jgi:hypothetical protein
MERGRRKGEWKRGEREKVRGKGRRETKMKKTEGKRAEEKGNRRGKRDGGQRGER